MFLYNKTFSSLFWKICDKYYPDDKYTVFHFTVDNFKHENKIKIYNSFLNSTIISKEDKKEFIRLYNESCRLLRTFQFFYSKAIYKKTENYNSVVDMSYEPLYILKAKQRFKFFQNDRIYTFSVTDMIRIIDNSLMSFDVDLLNYPVFPKNPYNNIKFPKVVLYKLYLHMKTFDKIPEIFKRFADCSFSMNTFLRKNEFFIRDYIIDNYNRILTPDQLYEQIIMFLRFQKIPNLFIHIDFPREEVIEKFETAIRYFRHACYSLSSLTRQYYHTLLNKNITDIMNNNPIFGRLILKGRYKKKSYPHLHYNIVNLMDTRIPNFDTFQSLCEFMEFGLIMPSLTNDAATESDFESDNEYEFLINESDDDDNNESDDDEDNETEDEIEDDNNESDDDNDNEAQQRNLSFDMVMDYLY